MQQRLSRLIQTPLTPLHCIIHAGAGILGVELWTMASNIHAMNASPCCKSGESFDRRGMSKTCQKISGSMDVGLTRHRNDYLKETKQQIASASPFTSDKHIDCMSIMCTYMKLQGEIEAASQVLMPVDPSNLPVCAWWGLHCAPVTGGNESWRSTHPMYDCAG